MMYAKAALTFPSVKAFYAVVNPNNEWIFCEDLLEPPKDNAKFRGPMPLRRLLEHLEGEKLDIVVPHMFDVKGMTSFRGAFEDILHVTVVGPDLFANVVAQNKAYTRDVLRGVGLPVPEGQLLERTPARMELLQGGKASFDELVEAFAQKMNDALAYAFSYTSADSILIEEFIPGREIRCGAIETLDGLQTVPAMVEYVMNKEMPIRTVTDKIQSGSDGSGMKQTKCERVIPADLDAATTERIRGYVARAHRALRSTDYSLFDFRVHAETGEAYIIEACMFWSFSSISAISLLVNASQEEAVQSCWHNAARRTQCKPASTFNNVTPTKAKN